MAKPKPKINVFKLRPQKPRQEFINGVTHGITALISIFLLGPFVILAALEGNIRHVISFAIFGSALVFLFGASTFMHFDRSRGSVRPIYGFLDHVGICLVIAGTYTPFCMVSLHGPLGWGLLAAVWAMALGFIALCFIYGERVMKYGNAVYLLMGWMIVIAIKPLAVALTLPGLALLVGGGVVYSIGVAYLIAKPVYHYHAIWHMFVNIGAILHLASMVFYVLPDGR